MCRSSILGNTPFMAYGPMGPNWRVFLIFGVRTAWLSRSNTIRCPLRPARPVSCSKRGEPCAPADVGLPVSNNHPRQIPRKILNPHLPIIPFPPQEKEHPVSPTKGGTSPRGAGESDRSSLAPKSCVQRAATAASDSPHREETWMYQYKNSKIER